MTDDRDHRDRAAALADVEFEATQRLDVLKALGDDTRYAIYMEIARSDEALGTSQIAQSLGLHVNTVRPHLERMREVGLLRVDTAKRGDVGRPQHVYSLAPENPPLSRGESAYGALVRGLLSAAVNTGMDPEVMVEAGRELGRCDAARWSKTADPFATLLVEQARQGFDPVVIESGNRTIQFHCPFRELAQANPDLVCGFHRGMVDGLVAELSDGCVKTRFSTLEDDVPCRVELVGR